MKSKGILVTIGILVMMLFSLTSQGQSYDFSVTNVDITNPTGISAGSSINIGTALNEVSFTIRNAGSTTVPAGTQVTVDFTIGSKTTPLVGTLSAALSPNAQTGFTMDCTSSGLNYDFPTTAGNFSICVTSTYSNDPVSSNNKLCSQYSMKSPSGLDLAIKSGSIEVTNPTGISQGSNISLGTPLNELRFIIDNVGTVGLGAGSSVGIEIEVGGIKKNTTLTLSNALPVSGSTIVTANTMSSGLDFNFPSSLGAFDICITVSSSSDINSSNNKHCQGYVMGSGSSTPQFSSMSPTSGPIGTTVSLFGSNFSTSGNTVKFSNNVFGSVISSTSSQIVVSVPTGTVTGPVEITTGGYALNAGVFTVTQNNGHSITSLSPNAGLVGSEVIIKGTKFSTNASAHTVTFSGGVTAPVKIASTTSLTVDVPVGAQTGLVTVRLNGVTVNSPQAFTVFSTPSMVITDFSPKKAAIGQQVAIEGDLFSTTGGNTVRFAGGSIATLVSVTAKKLIVVVPAGANDGYFTVNNGVTTATSPQIFEVDRGPVITDLTPSSGLAGSTATLIGFNFSTVAANNKVLFGSIDAGIPIVNGIGTELEVTVPPGLSPGAHTVRVTVDGVTAVAPKKFDVVHVGVEEEVNYNSLIANSSNGKVLVKIESAVVMNNTSLVIRDIQGKEIYRADLETKGLLNLETEINHEMKSGVYIVSIQEGTEPIMSTKILVTD